jgi:hypothetical protein
LVPDHLGREYVLDFGQLNRLLTQTPYRTLPLWMMASADEQQSIARRAYARTPDDARAILELAIGAVADRDFAAALALLEPLNLAANSDPRDPHLRAYALCRLGRAGEAGALGREWRAIAGPSVRDGAFWDWLEKTFPAGR